MTFQEWWDKNEHGWGTEQLAEYKLAKDSWEKATEEITKEIVCKLIDIDKNTDCLGDFNNKVKDLMYELTSN